MQNFILKKGKTYKNIFPQCTGNLCFLKGEIGAGKTTFVKNYVLYKWGINTITSPTFCIRQDYEFEGEYLIHADFYRLSDNRRRAVSLFEFIKETKILKNEQKTVCTIFIEWPLEEFISCNSMVLIFE